MAIRFCGDADLHAAHRWPFVVPAGEFEEYCLGRHSVGEGSWFAASHRRGDHRSAHFYLEGSARSLCGYGHQKQGGLPFDPGLGCTTVPDPRLGEPRDRRTCSHCLKAIG